MYRAIVQDGFNNEEPENTLKVVETSIPDAKPGHIVVQIKLRPINPTDLVAIRTGRFVRYTNQPIVPGSEGYGIIHKIGEGVRGFKPGDRVVPFMWDSLLNGGGGSWQEYVSVKENMLASVPDTISDEVASQFIINPWTVYGMLKDLAVPTGEYILQTAAGSVLGRQIIQLAKHWGIKTINVVRRAEQVEELRLLGADEVICSTAEDIVARVKEITDRKLAYGSLDCVGGVLTKIGEGVQGFKPGDRVVPFMWDSLLNGGGGSWQEYVSVKENMLALVPDSIPDEVASQFIINPWTVYGMLKDLAVPTGEYILQTAAGSALGRQIIQLAKHWGIKTINVVRRAEQVEELRLLRADEVICSTTEDIVARVKEITDRKLAYGSLDCVGGVLTKSVLASTRHGGQVYVYGVLSGDEAVIRINDLFRQVRVTGWILSDYWSVEERRNELVKEVWKLLESKVLEPYTGSF